MLQSELSSSGHRLDGLHMQICSQMSKQLMHESPVSSMEEAFENNKTACNGIDT